MELQVIKSQTTWNDAAERINRNNQKVATEISKLGAATYKNKGYFKTLDDLTTAYPTSSLGSVAYIGVRYPFTVFRWSGTGWVTDGTVGGEENVDLSGYYTKEETHEAIKEEYEVMTQAAYDALASKEDKLYFCTEE